MMSAGLGGALAAPMESLKGQGGSQEKTLGTLGSVFMTLTLSKMEKLAVKLL